MVICGDPIYNNLSSYFICNLISNIYWEMYGVQVDHIDHLVQIYHYNNFYIIIKSVFYSLLEIEVYGIPTSHKNIINNLYDLELL